MFFISITFGNIISFIIIYGKQIGVNNPAKIMSLGFVGGILSFVILFFAKGDILFDLAAICMGIMHGICAPSIIAMAINRVEDTKRGTALSAQDLGMGIGPMILGNLSNIIGLSCTYLLCGFIMIIPFAIFYLKEMKIYKNISDVEEVI